MRFQLALIAVALTSLSAQATVNLNAPNATYSQSFDTLASSGNGNGWINNSTLAGWSVYRNSSANFSTAIDATAYNANNGGSNAGALYSYGSTGSSDRALGSVGSGNAAAGSYWYVLGLTNASLVAFNSFTLSYTGEQWRNSAAGAQTAVLEYGFGSSAQAVSSWVATGFNFTSPVTGGSAGALDGNANALSLGGTLAADWQAGQTLWLRWTDLDQTGADHGLAIDNVSLSVTAVPEPQTYALMLAGLGAIGALARRRKA